MQDEARHVAYGTMHLRYRLERDPSLAEDFHAYLDRGEDIISVLFTTPSVVEPAAILAAGSLAAAEETGLDASDLVRTRVVEEYLARCDRAGLSRRGRMHLPSAILAGTDGAATDSSVAATR